MSKKRDYTFDTVFDDFVKTSNLLLQSSNPSPFPEGTLQSIKDNIRERRNTASPDEDKCFRALVEIVVDDAHTAIYTSTEFNKVHKNSLETQKENPTYWDIAALREQVEAALARHIHFSGL